jgi:hypothetical protein|tara:strand:+ start:1893 stop:3005 length:1113 start_codon:yes stop_codon:yes gene_type:complete
MRRDIINASALQNAINELLEGGTPPSLQGHLTTIRSGIHRAAEHHCSVRKARRRKGDPDWAQRKITNGHTLYRFDVGDKYFEPEIKELIRELGKVVDIASGRGVFSGPANAFLRGLSHTRQRDLDELLSGALKLVDQAEIAAFRAQRHEVLRDPVRIMVGPLIGSPCVSIGDVMQLGREAQNCLADNRDYWEEFRSGDYDFWSLRQEDRLIAVLKVEKGENQVVEALGPSNNTIGINDVRQVATFCKEAGLRIGAKCDGLCADYAAPFQVEPTLIKIKGRFAIYAEWPTAVRIDMRKEDASGLAFLYQTKVLELSFDSQRSCVDMVFEGQNHLHEVKAFGRKELRKIVRHVAMCQTNPTLVQHRLLALAA